MIVMRFQTHNYFIIKRGIREVYTSQIWFQCLPSEFKSAHTDLLYYSFN